MIIDETNGYLDTAKASPEAQDTEHRQSLAVKLDYLDTYGTDCVTRCTLYKDFARLSFQFAIEVQDSATGEFKHWISGGLIFHDGNWSVHT